MSKNPSPICPDCGKRMTLTRTVPRLGGLPQLNVFRCARCKIVFTEQDTGKSVRSGRSSSKKRLATRYNKARSRMAGDEFLDAYAPMCPCPRERLPSGKQHREPRQDAPGAFAFMTNMGSGRSRTVGKAIMGQSASRRPVALVVEEDHDQRAMAAVLLEETELNVIECDTAEAALAAMETTNDRIAMAFVNVRLPGKIDGVEFAQIVKSERPEVDVIVT
jgi:hypothetical protein